MPQGPPARENRDFAEDPITFATLAIETAGILCYAREYPFRAAVCPPAIFNTEGFYGH